MMDRKVGGYVLILFGITLIILALFSGPWALIYGIPILIIGVIILLNSGEDKIEEIKYKRRTKSKK